MIELLEPDVFWSDIILGSLALLSSLLVLKRDRVAGFFFLFLALSTWFGAFYHGLINTTTLPLGELLWTATMLLLGVASICLLRISYPNTSRTLWTLIFLLYSIVIVLVSEKFLVGLVFQGAGFISYLLHLRVRARSNQHPRFKRALILCAFSFILTGFAIYVQQAEITFGSAYSHNTIFHIIEMPAVILLAFSVYILNGRR